MFAGEGCVGRFAVPVSVRHRGPSRRSAACRSRALSARHHRVIEVERTRVRNWLNSAFCDCRSGVFHSASVPVEFRFAMFRRLFEGHAKMLSVFVTYSQIGPSVAGLLAAIRASGSSGPSARSGTGCPPRLESAACSPRVRRDRHADLLEGCSGTAPFAPSRACLSAGKQTHQDRDDRDDHQHLDERERGGCRTCFTSCQGAPAAATCDNGPSKAGLNAQAQLCARCS